MCSGLTVTACGRNVTDWWCDGTMSKRDGKGRQSARRHLSVVPSPDPADDIDIRNRYNEEVPGRSCSWSRSTTGFLALCKDDPLTADKVEEALDELAAGGPQLGRPLVDRIHGSRIHNLKELRPHIGGKLIRRKNEGGSLGGHQTPGP